VRDGCSESELTSYWRAVGNVMGEMWDGILKPILSAPPTLRYRSCRSPMPNPFEPTRWQSDLSSLGRRPRPAQLRRLSHMESER
jgi:hypothetical protein